MGVKDAEGDVHKGDRPVIDDSRSRDVHEAGPRMRVVGLEVEIDMNKITVIAGRCIAFRDE